MKDTENSLPTRDAVGHTQIGFPVQIYFFDLAKLYMHRIRWHWHTEFEAMMIKEGEAAFLADDTRIHLKAGEGILINQNVMHSLRPLEPDQDCTVYSVVFHPSFLFGYGNTVMSSKYLVPVLSSPAMRLLPLQGAGAWQKKVLGFIQEIITLSISKKYGYELMIKAFLCQLWTVMLEKIVPENVTTTRQAMISTDETRVKEAILYMEKHYAEPITLDQLASSIHISKSECCRCFKRTLQFSPIEYLMKYRIFTAANLLQKADPASRSISELAFNVGFNNASYFNKVFRQYLGCTPSEYRRKMQNDPTDEAGSFRPFRL